MNLLSFVVDCGKAENDCAAFFIFDLTSLDTIREKKRPKNLQLRFSIIFRLIFHEKLQPADWTRV